VQYGLFIQGRHYDTSRLMVKGINRVSNLPGAPPEITIHRVVDQGHPSYADALKGIVRPWGQIPPLSLENVIRLTEGTRPDTGLTCWSTRMEYTMGLALPGDVILVHRVRSSDAIIPPNPRPNESEVHVHGVITGARVVRR